MQNSRVFAFLLGALALSAAASNAAAALSGPWAEHIAHASSLDDPFAERAALFLAEHAPQRDAAIDADLLQENLELALRARAEFPWARDVPDELFLNDVLPYASVDEPRERWRPALYAISKQIVADATTLEDAAQRLNDELFDIVGVHYNTGRKRANQSVFESMKQGRATCTGLSIILVNACRSVGIPARIAGVREWVSTPGNHTWVEVWDGQRWRFTGADELDERGLDHAWFVGRASTAVPGSEPHGVWATSWRQTGSHFPMAWSQGDQSVPGVEVTGRYRPSVERTPPTDQGVARFFRVWDRPGGERLAARLTLRSARGSPDETLLTRAGREDLNDMPSAVLSPGSRCFIDVVVEGGSLRTVVQVGGEATGVVDLHLSQLALSQEAANRFIEQAIASRADELRRSRAQELADEAVAIGQHTMRYSFRSFGDDEGPGRALWISLHGGGGTLAEVNDRQWQNQKRLYEPSEGVYVAPRAPTDTWNLWHQSHIDPLLDRLIENMVLANNVDPDRVYLLGYSAGGDGVYQLAPRMADRFAAASMMAGHPNEASPLGLRNLPFSIYMGAEDSAYKRNEVAQQWGDALEALRAADPEGYEHAVTIYPGLGHWMNGRDAEALPWMRRHRRDAWPDRLVWRQDDVIGTRFYWLSVRPDDAAVGQVVRARVEGQSIAVTAAEDEAPERITLRLSDELLDLDTPLTVTVNGVVIFEGTVLRTRAAIQQSLEERHDPSAVATALLEVRLR